jgi:hypothetical protein
MSTLAEARHIVRRMNTVLHGRWQPMFWSHLEFLMYFFEKAVSKENGSLSWRWEAMFGPEAALGDMLTLELGAESGAILEELKRWLSRSVYERELGIVWEPKKDPRSCN